MNDAIDVLVFISACGAVLAYLCRLDALQWGKHRADIILMHMAWAGACAAAASHAWVGDAGLIDVCSVSGSLLWIFISYGTWRASVPRQFDTAPAPLTDEQMSTVNGRGPCE